LKEGVILHLDEKGLPLEIEILDAAKLSMIDEISVFPAFGHKQMELPAAI
jgi:3-deoxy-D-arabino-heptulosonate 7-phosphate (DAHP) synthase